MRKKILAFIFMIYSHSSNAQLAVADPAVTQMDVVNIDGITQEFASFILPNKIIQLKIPIFNLHQFNSIPAGSCKLKINLGKYLLVDPLFDLTNAPLNNYFNWSSNVVAGSLEITGDLYTAMEGDFTETAIFNLKAKDILGTDEIITNFSVTNHNTSVILQDEDVNNNIATIQYTITREAAPVPVTFTNYLLTKKDCNIEIKFRAENPVNVHQFEIELSRNGTNFQKVGELAATNHIQFSFNYSITPNISANQLFFRIKFLDNDGKFGYSETKTVSGICNKKELKVSIFPNPVEGNKNEITIKATNGSFNGKYNISIVDLNGILFSNQQHTYAFVNQFNYTVNMIPAGHYVLKLHNENNEQVTNLAFQILQ